VCASRQVCVEDHLRLDRSHIAGCSFCASQGKPIISPPAEHAANWVESKHRQEAIERMQLTWLEFNRVATRAHSSNPQYPRQPIRPSHRCNVHAALPFTRMRICIRSQLHCPRWNVSPTMREDCGYCRWLMLRRNPLRRNTGEWCLHPYRWFVRKEIQRR